MKKFKIGLYAFASAFNFFLAGYHSANQQWLHYWSPILFGIVAGFAGVRLGQLIREAE